MEKETGPYGQYARQKLITKVADRSSVEAQMSVLSRLGKLWYKQTVSSYSFVSPHISNVSVVALLHKHTLPRRGYKQLDGSVDTQSSEFIENVQGYQDYLTTYQDKVKLALSGGGPKSTKRYVEQHGKMLPEDKLRHIIDEGTEFLELMQLAGLGMEYGNVPRASCLTGIGLIDGIHTVISINDGSVKGGTIFPITLKKQLRLQEVTLQNKLPSLSVIDSGGAFLPLQNYLKDEIFPEYGGRMFYNEALLSAMNIPQLSVISGSCTAGGAYLPMMTQECVIVDKLGSMYLGGPPLVYAALGEIVTSEDLGGAKLHCGVSGCTDHFASSEQEAFELCRTISTTYNMQPVPQNADYNKPLYDSEELTGLVPRTTQHNMDMYKVISRLTDGSALLEFKAMYGGTIIAGFAYIQGWLVGLLANNGPMTEAACNKATHFVQLCAQRGTPIVFLQNSTPQSNVNTSEKQEDIDITKAIFVRAFSRMMSVVATTNVPKITVIVGNSFAENNYAMCGRSFSPSFLFSWPNASIGCTDYTQLHEQLEKENADTADLHTKMTAFHSAQNAWDDGIILPQDTRKTLGQCLSIVYQQTLQSIPVPQEYPVLRM